jgi:hypothetical protein
MLMTNHFGVAQPDNVNCHVMEYHWGRNMLLIRLKRQNSPEVQYIKFGGVEYFAGPMEWTGANFTLRGAEECLQVLKDAERVGEFVTADMIKERGLSLYTAELGNSLVVIVSKSAHKYSA